MIPHILLAVQNRPAIVHGNLFDLLNRRDLDWKRRVRNTDKYFSFLTVLGIKKSYTTTNSGIVLPSPGDGRGPEANAF
jgi:hypothetical protein